MKDVRTVVAENLTQLRKTHKLTQAQLAEKFNYSDKAVCRWEHGDTLPDINILYALAEFYGVTMNDLVDPGFEAVEGDKREKTVFKYRLFISAMTLTAIWLLTVVLFITSIAYGTNYWIIFIWAIPVSCLSLVLLWRRHGLSSIIKIIIYSVFIWTLITAIFLHLFFVTGVNAWTFYLIGIPMEGLVIFWQQIKEYRTYL